MPMLRPKELTFKSPEQSCEGVLRSANEIWNDSDLGRLHVSIFLYFLAGIS